MHLEHGVADLGGIPGQRLSDTAGLAGLLLAAANAAGLDPASAPLVRQGPRGVAAFLPCHSGFVALHAVPDEGLCFVDVAGLGPIHPQRGLDIVAKRLGARALRTDARRRGAVTQPIEPERL